MAGGEIEVVVGLIEVEGMAVMRFLPYCWRYVEHILMPAILASADALLVGSRGPVSS